MLRNIGEYVSGRMENLVFVRTKTKRSVRKAPGCRNVKGTEQQNVAFDHLKTPKSRTTKKPEAVAPGFPYDLLEHFLFASYCSNTREIFSFKVFEQGATGC